MLMMLGCFVVTGTTAVSAEQGTEELPSVDELSRITELIQQLGAVKYRDREKAENALRAKGLLALEALREVQQHEDIEIRLRARNLARELRGQFIQQGVPPELQALLRDYESQKPDQRRALIRRLGLMPELSAKLVLARLARFDESGLLAREAALNVIGFNFDELDSSASAIKAMKTALGFSRRPPVLWIRSHLKSYEDVDIAQSDFENWLNDERSLVETASADSNKSVVDRLVRLNIDMLLRAGKKEAAFDAMRQLDSDGSPTNLLLSFEWMLERDAWPVIEEFASKHRKGFDTNAVMLYRLAEVQKLSGKPEEAEATAKRAFDTEGEKLVNYAAIYKPVIGVEGDRALRQAPQDVGARRYAMARVLEDEFGLYNWAEREYRAAIDAEVINSRARFDMQAMNDLSLMLHDQLDVAGSVEVLEKLIKEIEGSKESKRDFEAQFFSVEKLQSRLAFHRSIVAGENKDYEKQRDLLDEALELDPSDVDVVIGMYRAKEVSDYYREKTLKLLKEYEEQFISEIDEMKKSLRIVNNSTERRQLQSDLATKQNQYAWLIGNTEGDYAKAIKASHESLAQVPGLWVYLDTLGRAYYGKGDYKNAVKYQRMAAKGMPHEGQINRQLKLFEDALAKETAGSDASANKES